MIPFLRILTVYYWFGVLVLLCRPDPTNAWFFGRFVCILFGCDGDNTLLGTVKLDFYRTYEEKKFMFIFPYKEHSISKIRIYDQVRSVNAWFDGRVKFELGDIYSYDNVTMHEIDGSADYLEPCYLLDDFALSGEMNADRISIVVSKRFISPQRPLFGCAARLDIPLGGASDGLAPSVIMTMSNDASIPGSNIPELGISVLAGALLTHEIAHVMGLEHTARSSQGVVRYSQCDLFLAYPYFCNADAGCSDEVRDVLTGETFMYSDWEGRSNLIAPFSQGDHFSFSNFFEMGLFEKRYTEIFEDIIECWFSRAASNN